MECFSNSDIRQFIFSQIYFQHLLGFKNSCSHSPHDIWVGKWCCHIFTIACNEISLLQSVSATNTCNFSNLIIGKQRCIYVPKLTMQNPPDANPNISGRPLWRRASEHDSKHNANTNISMFRTKDGPQILRATWQTFRVRSCSWRRGSNLAWPQQPRASLTYSLTKYLHIRRQLHLLANFFMSWS